MVLIQDVLRYILRPVERKFKVWETAPGLKGKMGRWMRIGKAPMNASEGMLKAANSVYMMLYMFTQRIWGPVYKRAFEMEMHPGKFVYLFTRHRWIMLFWLGHTFMDDTVHINSLTKNSDYMLYYEAKYSRKFPRNSMNWRTSAHYIEIQHIYIVEMMKKFLGLEKEAWAKYEQARLTA